MHVPGTPSPSPGSLRLLPLGIGDAFSTLHYSTSFLLLAGGGTVLVDVPAPFGKILREAATAAGLALHPADITDVVLTHLHRDHCNGLEELAHRRKFLCDAPPPRLYILEELVERCWEERLAPALGGKAGEGSAAERIGEFFDLRPVSPGEPFAVGETGLVLHPRLTRHSQPCFGFRAELGGVRLGYSCDTEWDPDFFGWLADGAALVVHEAGEAPPHTPLEALMNLPEESRRLVRLAHLPDTLAERELPIPPLRPGELLTLKPEDGE